MFGPLTQIESFRLWNTVVSREPRLGPIAYDWDEWEERWCLGFDASRHAIPNQQPIPFPGHEINAEGANLPEVPEAQRLDALEFEVFVKHYFQKPTEATNEILAFMRMNYPALVAVKGRIEEKLASLFEED